MDQTLRRINTSGDNNTREHSNSSTWEMGGAGGRASLHTLAW